MSPTALRDILRARLPRRSTWALLVAFVAVLVLYLFVRPDTPPAAPAVVVPAQTLPPTPSPREGSPQPTARPTRRSTPSPARPSEPSTKATPTSAPPTPTPTPTAPPTKDSSAPPDVPSSAPQDTTTPGALGSTSPTASAAGRRAAP